MKNFFLLALAGVIAQLVDGSLGMAYGVSSATVLLAAAVFLFILGIYVLSRFAFRRTERPVEVRHVPRAFLSPLGFVAGFLDAFGGGGWGPIATPTLLSSGRMEPRKIIGTVDTSEFVIAF